MKHMDKFIQSPQIVIVMLNQYMYKFKLIIN